MRTLEFKDRTEELKIAGKIYAVDFTSRDFIKKVQVNLDEITEAEKKMKETGDIDDLIDALKQLINYCLDNDFDRIWEECHKSVYNLLDVSNLLGEVIKDAYKYKAQKYV